MVNFKEIESYKNYGKVLCITNGVIEAYVTLDIGPRIIRFGYVNGKNFMCTDREGLGYRTSKEFTDLFGEGKKWENMGGHRVWLSPESYPETYTPDDVPVEVKKTANGAIFTQIPYAQLGFRRSIEIKMDPDDANMQVDMHIKNISESSMEFSVWSLSVCAAGGTLIIPMNTNDTGLLSNRIVSVWPYTDMSDSRIYWGKKYVTIKQDVNATTPVKLGFDLNCGIAYYVLEDEILYKNYETKHPTAKYPDGGCSFETYTNAKMIEFETLSELKNIAPGEIHSHTEHWSLCKTPCKVDFRNDSSIDNLLEKI